MLPLPSVPSALRGIDLRPPLPTCAFVGASAFATSVASTSQSCKPAGGNCQHRAARRPCPGRPEPNRKAPAQRGEASGRAPSTAPDSRRRRQAPGCAARRRSVVANDFSRVSLWRRRRWLQGFAGNPFRAGPLRRATPPRSHDCHSWPQRPASEVGCGPLQPCAPLAANWHPARSRGRCYHRASLGVLVRSCRGTAGVGCRYVRRSTPRVVRPLRTN